MNRILCPECFAQTEGEEKACAHGALFGIACTGCGKIRQSGAAWHCLGRFVPFTLPVREAPGDPPWTWLSFCPPASTTTIGRRVEQAHCLDAAKALSSSEAAWIAVMGGERCKPSEIWTWSLPSHVTLWEGSPGSGRYA